MNEHESITVDHAEAALDLLPPIFRDCCDPEDGRYSLSAPWTHGDYIYATDGRICVRQPRKFAEMAAVHLMAMGERKVPKAEDVFVGEEEPGQPASLPDHIPGSKKCQTCFGGEIQPTCPHCEQEMDCQDCDGIGTYWDFDARYPVAEGVDLGHKYARLLREHGVTDMLHWRPGKGVRFRLGNIEGVVMPLNPKESR